ncbi:DUF1971 domain-containing protein [Cetobacterium somerae]
MKCNCEKEKTELKRLNPDIEGDASEVIEEEIQEKIEDDKLADVKLYDNLIFPEGLEKVGETPWMNEQNVFPDILKKHMAPKDKLGYLIVKKGELEFVWEDEEEKVYTVDAKHPLIIYPERYHHVILKGPVELKIKFYKFNVDRVKDMNALRPGEEFIKK